MAAKPVFLAVDREAVLQVGRPFGGDLDGFISAVKDGPPWATHRGLCQRALQGLDGWRTRDLRYPPYIGYLGLFVLAAGVEGDFAPHAYYPRLRSLLADGPGSMLPSFDRMLDLWDDLERWSVRDMTGELGLFEAAIAGNWIHVGLPIAQTLLTERERRELPRIFSSADLDPTAPPSDSALADVVRVHGKDQLRPRTTQLLATRSDQDLFEILIDVISNELANWDGQVIEDHRAGPRIQARIYSSLRLGLAVNLTANSARTVIRCRLNREFPDHRLVLTSSDSTICAECEEFLPGWSSPLIDRETRKPIDGARLDWISGAHFNEQRLAWKFRLAGRRVRAFVDAGTEDLPDLIETHRLQRHRPFYILFHDEAWPHIREWAEGDCKDFQTFRLTGLPPRWQLAECAGATSDARVRTQYPTLSFSDRVRVRFVDGIRASAGNSFFAFAPPKVVLEDAEGDEEVRCGSAVLTTSSGNATFVLPSSLPTESRISIEVIRDGRSLARSSLYLVGSFDWRERSNAVRFDALGQCALDNETVTITGALIEGNVPDTSSFALPVLFTPGLDARDERRIFFIGRRAGEIITWPHEALSSDWNAVWAVSLSRNGRVTFLWRPSRWRGTTGCG